MKKFAVILFAAAIVLAFTLPAAAIEHQLGGFFRVIPTIYKNMTGEDSTEARDLSLLNSRTRIYYTAKFSDDFKFVNSFEMDWTYGDTSRGGGGDISTDGMIVELARSYVDFNVPAMKDINLKIGLIPVVLARGILEDENFAGIQASWVQPGKKLIVPFYWLKGYEGGTGIDANDKDVDIVAVSPVWKTGNWTFNPVGMVWYSDNATAMEETSDWNDLILYYIGANFDFKFKQGGAWGTLIYQGGEVDDATTLVTSDVSAWALAVGGDMNVGPVNLSAQFNYFTGDDDPNDGDFDDFFVPFGGDGGQGYNNTSELLGKGIFFAQRPGGSAGQTRQRGQSAAQRGIWDEPTNVWMIGGAVKYSLIKNLQLQGDLWYSELVEAIDGNPDKTLGTEVDLSATLKFHERINLIVKGAYLFAGDGFYQGANEADPWELGAMMSFSF